MIGFVECVDINVDRVTCPTSKEFDAFSRDTVGRSRNCRTFTNRMARESNGGDTGTKEQFSQFGKEKIPRKRLIVWAGKQWIRGTPSWKGVIQFLKGGDGA